MGMMGKDNTKPIGKNTDQISKQESQTGDPTAFFEKQLERTNSWLNFAEAKSAGMIAVNIALIAVVINLFQSAKVLTTITVIVLIISSMLCLITFFPNLGKNVVIDEEKSNSKKLNLVFFGDISKMSSAEEYIDNVVNNYYPGDDDFKNDILIRDLAEEIVVNSQITVKKYSLFRKAVLADIVAFIFAITTFVAA